MQEEPMIVPSRRRRRRRPPWYRSPWRVAGGALATALAVAVAALVLALLVVPRLTGGAALTVLTGSMVPALAPGDVVVTRGVAAGDVCADVGVGTVVTFLPRPGDPELITHRVVGKTIGTFDDGTACRLITQGDANSAVDDPVSPQQVRGVLLYRLPGLGWVRQWAGEHRAAVAVLVALAALGYGALGGARGSRTRAVLVPGPAAPVPPAGGGVADAVTAARAQALRERELDLREREVAVRERELALRRDPGPIPRPDPHDPRRREAPCTPST
jgi:signal peptidase